MCLFGRSVVWLFCLFSRPFVCMFVYWIVCVCVCCLLVRLFFICLFAFLGWLVLLLFVRVLIRFFVGVVACFFVC